ncbi:MAG: phenylalanine--tRNA ligase subunit alpha [Ignavibacteria bacterium RIFCSPLOWO2_02_FULL_55_14]|nr:MAG: phenylalanine--tRNA ligase subunit alpha [Ignavibacteria bacterium GWC2_56_12]OGU68356.1 MAG: phenylalanine--tRNA ligase subunit alpha [Ignavibacteria bacterium RIFCSPHIGHO2_02_FULL_56_12]OGU71304.1 MAG: phenylalanine--tRNA ligase subunit alpha [Ignavibacteria bacterium RIFCSPLOWO2_12_FULL_56_21]OGU75595.1 MAG: phenylalanine--tRNA ligase subunit alpha [Ignavibacteria bacterium RIFCSPLOWO2_02_FULL_55_14]HAV24102.1 phenylalanine--tRNA ligase subunit alpha [Bacteroidota bacterium]
MLDRIDQTRAEAGSDAAGLLSAESLEQFRVKYLARKGAIAELFEGLKAVPAGERPLVGKALNALRNDVQSLYDNARATLEAGRGEAAAVDVTLPGRGRYIGSTHLVTRTLEEFQRIFVSMGFNIVTGPEIESEYYNFEALNFPPDHPARDMQDTFFITKNVLLRTHTTPVQVRIMERQQPPVRAIMPGRVYRNEAVSPRALVQFHQVDGIYVDKGVTFAELKGTLVSFARQYYGSSIKYRFRASYFPFTEPSAEMDITCYLCGGKGCRVCKHTGWLEIVGSGMVHPKILQRVGYDTEKVTGYAFGFGVERTVLLRHDINDIRLLYENDVRFLRQF